LKTNEYAKIYKSILIFRHISCGYENKNSSPLISSFCFHTAWGEKGTDRFYTWPDALSHLKEMVYVVFLIWIYIEKSTKPICLVDC